mgnify:CR=1 FL=1
MTFIWLQKIDILGLGFQQKFSSSKSSYLKHINLLSHAPRKLYLGCLMILAGNVFNQYQPQYKMRLTRHYYFNPSVFLGSLPNSVDLIYTRYASHNFIGSFLQLCSRGVSVYLTKNRVIGRSTFPVQNTHKRTCQVSCCWPKTQRCPLQNYGLDLEWEKRENFSFFASELYIYILKNSPALNITPILPGV